MILNAKVNKSTSWLKPTGSARKHCFFFAKIVNKTFNLHIIIYISSLRGLRKILNLTINAKRPGTWEILKKPGILNKNH